ncbi:hypothetical protein PHMEG_00019681 [Phytophthora megakarya]|uniref:Uncharacterized protein n=1 Tax=Phytophthora megakarya TaxID=4795 RepID=A0A225VQW5_9STRA|nr:hypothetical protein PHMEG_00019681 [Phytophthora megakarya]
MPKTLPWQAVALCVDGSSADALLDNMKAFDITKSNTMACTMCVNLDTHNMRYRLMECSSEACATVSLLGCRWRGKTLTCIL